MDIQYKKYFLERWEKYFGQAELPVTFYYTNEINPVELRPPAKGRSCFICEMASVRKGENACYNKEAVACTGGKRYLGFSDHLRPKFEYFLSCGIENEMEGERYKRSPEIVLELMKNQKHLQLPGRYLVCKRWDHLEEKDHPEIVVFFAMPDVLSGLFTLANFDRVEPNAVFAPFGAGCGSIIHYPYLEKDAEQPRAVIGLFDPSARVCVPPGVLTFALPMKRFEQLVGYMDESFLITGSWEKVRKRI